MASTMAATPATDHAEHGEANLLLAALGGAALAAAGVVELTGVTHHAVADLAAAVAAVALAAPIVARAARNLLSGKHDLHELVALTIVAALALEQPFTAGLLALLATFAEAVEHRTAWGARAAIEAVVRLAPARARRVESDGREVEVEATALRPGDRIRLRPGDRVPADGEVLTGESIVDEQAITGESTPAERGPGGRLFAGTTNLTGLLEAVVSRAGDDTTLARVRQLILAAETTRTPTARLVERVSQAYVPAALMLGGIVLFVTREPERVMSLLVVAGPSALVLAGPSACVAALAAAARLGILVRSAKDLEAAGRLSLVVFDKTGTLTTGRLKARRLVVAHGEDAVEVLRAAGALARGSTHPAARAVAAVAVEARLEAPPVSGLEEVPGRGLRGLVDGRAALLGRWTFLEEAGVAPAALDPGPEGAALTQLHVAVDGRHVGLLAIDDGVRPEARAAVATLRELGVGAAMLTGDRAAVASRVAAEVGIDDVVAEQLPQDKLAVVRSARAEGWRVGFVGDGVNDAPALAAADLGVALAAAGSDVAINTAGAALLGDDLTRVAFLVRLSRRLHEVTTQNVALALGAMAAGLALSAAGLLPPLAALVLHNAGDLAVVFNSARLVREGEELG